MAAEERDEREGNEGGRGGESLAPSPSTSSMSGSPVMVLEYRLRPTWRAIFGVALPSSSMNVAPPLLTTGQSALLGHSGGAIALASYGSVSTAISLAARVSSFLCDASSAKVGTAIGERNWAKLADAIQTGIAYAMALGLATVMILSALGPVVFARVLRLEGAVLAAAGEYFKLALIKVPFTLVGLVINGALQGIRQNNVLAGTTAFFSVLEFVLDWTAVQLPDICPGRSLLWKFGVIGIIIAALQVTATGGMLLKLKPVEADEGFSLYRELRERLVIPDAEPTDGSQVEDGNEVVEEQGSGLVLRSGMTDMLIRSLVMQGTFAWALLCASRLSDSTTALAAHHIITNMWMVISYFVDGFSAVRLNPDFCAAPSLLPSLPLRRSLRRPPSGTLPLISNFARTSPGLYRAGNKNACTVGHRSAEYLDRALPCCRPCCRPRDDGCAAPGRRAGARFLHRPK